MKSLLHLLAALFLMIGNVEAKIKLPSLLSDNMVLQQQTSVRLWGESSPNATVTVAPSWSKAAAHTKADNKGCWELFIQTPAASFTQHTLKFTDGESVTLRNILIGEVWLCAGQSNMVMPLNGFDYCPIRDANQVIADAPNHPVIRMVTIKPKVALTPQMYTEGSWQMPSTENAKMFSAAAYHYALALQRTLQVPVGIITSAWGGSRVEGWLPKEILKTYKDEDLSIVGTTDKVPVYMQGMLMYNALIYPCHNYTIKGFLWYQGESNVKSSHTYAERLATMVEHWRTLWKQKDLPFYFVEIAPFACEYKRDGWIGALLREAQFKAQSLIPNSGMIGTNDLVEDYEEPQIHTCNKKDIGERLAFMALNRTYRYVGVESDYPSYKSMNISGDKIEIALNHAERGISPWIGIKGFEIAGDDKVFHPAEASLNQKEHTITVFSNEVKQPIAVRYCFRNFLKGNVINLRNLPLIPFRTDDWHL